MMMFSAAKDYKRINRPISITVQNFSILYGRHTDSTPKPLTAVLIDEHSHRQRSVHQEVLNLPQDMIGQAIELAPGRHLILQGQVHHGQLLQRGQECAPHDHSHPAHQSLVSANQLTTPYSLEITCKGYLFHNLHAKLLHPARLLHYQIDDLHVILHKRCGILLQLACLIVGVEPLQQNDPLQQ